MDQNLDLGEVLFENETEYNEKMLRSHAGRVLLPTQIFCLVLMASCLLLLISSRSFGLLFLGVIGMIVYVLLLPYIKAKRNMKDNARFLLGRPTTMYWKFGNCIHLESYQSQAEFGYHQFVKVAFFSWGCALFISKNQAYLISADGFTKGTYEDFKKFLKTKRPDWKIPT